MTLDVMWRKNKAVERRMRKMGDGRFWEREHDDGKITDEDFRVLTASVEEAHKMAQTRFLERWEEAGGPPEDILRGFEEAQEQDAFSAELTHREFTDWALSLWFKAGLIEPISLAE